MGDEKSTSGCPNWFLLLCLFVILRSLKGDEESTSGHPNRFFFTLLRTTAVRCKQNSRKLWLLAAFMCDVAYTAFLRSHYRDQVSGVLSKELSAVASSPSGLPYSVRAVSVRGPTTGVNLNEKGYSGGTGGISLMLK